MLQHPSPEGSTVRGMMRAGIEGGVDIQARSNIDVFIGPSWQEVTDPMQYVDQVDDTAGMTHYLAGRLRLTTASLTTRVNWTFSPKLSLQAYAQPFVAAGSYSELKDIVNPHARNYKDRFVPVTGRESFALDKPDFQLRSAAIDARRALGVSTGLDAVRDLEPRPAEQQRRPVQSRQ